VQRVVASKFYNTSSKQAFNFSVNPFPLKYRTRSKKASSGRIRPGVSGEVMEIFSRSEEEINLAYIDMFNLSRQEIEESIRPVVLKGEEQPTWTCVKRTRVASAVLDRDNLNKEYKRQSEAYVAAKGTLAGFERIPPFIDHGPSSSHLQVMPSYAKIAKESALKMLEDMQNSVNPYLTNLFELEVNIAPFDSDWNDLVTRPSIAGQSPVIANALLKEEISVGFDLEIAYTLCDGPSWESSNFMKALNK